MLADHSTIHTTFEYLPLLAIAAVGAGWLLGSFRRGRTDAAREALDFANNEIAVLKNSNERMTREMTEMRAGNAKLEGLVEQLREENGELRRLVMLEKIPPALAVALESMVQGVMDSVERMHTETRNDLVAHFDRTIDQNRLYWTEQVGDRLHPIEQGIARLLTADHAADAPATGGG